MVKSFFTIDAETDPFKFNREPKPFIWGCYNAEQDFYAEFATTLELVQFMRNQDAIFYAHNGGKFDFMFLAEYFNRNEKCLMINGRLVQVRLGNAELRDSYALLPFPLKGYKKKDIDYRKLEKKVRKKHMVEIKEYLRSDCVYLYELIEAFNSEYGRHLTAPSAAIKTMMKMEHLKIENEGALFFQDFEKYYFGGRCECLKSGEYHEKLTYLDINSAYMHAMLSDHPIGAEYKTTYHAKPDIVAHGFYHVVAKSFGAFCRRDKGTLIFDWDGEEREYYTTGHELLAAIHTGMATGIRHIEQNVFINTKRFNTFINHFWGLRCGSEKGSTDNLFAKLMGNSCYGKFCSNPSNYENYMFVDPAISEWMTTTGWDIKGEKGGHTLMSRPLEGTDMRYYNVATGASITGFVRAMLMRALASIDNPIYCDTDSIIFTGGHELPLSPDLGAWKLEGTFTEGYFAGKKLYGVKKGREPAKIATKGSRLEYKDIKDICAGKTVIYNQDAPQFSWKTKKNTFLSRKIKKTA